MCASEPSEPFSFSRLSEWPKWARRFERFRVASGLGSKGEEVQVNTLLYAMGDDADDILRSFQLSAADQKKYSEVKGRFDQHFLKKRIAIFERARCNRRKQAYIQTAVQSPPATEVRLEEIRVSQEHDEACQKVKNFCVQGWPKWSELSELVQPFHTVSGELTITDGILMRGGRIVIPRDLQSGVLRQLHSSHQGISKSRERAKQSVWWPGLSKQLEETVQKCPVCIKFQIPRAEPLLSSEIPRLPWQKVGTDLFEWEKSNYLLVVDYQSRWIEIVRLPQTTSRSIVNHMSSIFARYGIPELVVSDNGPQYSSDCFKEFARTYGFQHVTSSPHYPQANGEAERAVQTIKGLLKKSPDPYLALLAYRATPLALGYTPSELLMGRKLRTTVRMIRELRKPAVPNLEEVAERQEGEAATDRQLQCSSRS